LDPLLKVCLAPIVRAADFQYSHALYTASLSSGNRSLWQTPPPAVPITAWAKCQGYGLCTRSEHSDGSGKTLWSEDAFDDPCVEGWTGPPTLEGKMHVVSYFGQGTEWKDSGGYDIAINAAGGKQLQVHYAQYAVHDTHTLYTMLIHYRP
jgi:hypothetical protein